MDIETRNIGNYVVVEPREELGDETSTDFIHFMEKSLEKGHKDFLINLENVPSINMLGIEAILQLWKIIGEAGGSLFIAGRPKMESLPGDLMLDPVIKIYETEEEFSDNVLGKKSSKITVDSSERNKYHIIRIKGGFDINPDTRVLKKELMDLINSGHKFIAVDMTEIDYLYSSIIGVLSLAASRLRAEEGDLCLFGLKEKIRKLVRAVNLHRYIDIYPDRNSLPE
ncbi:MAG: STAS domain-containing protein [Fibrobacterota bacterium]